MAAQMPGMMLKTAFLQAFGKCMNEERENESVLDTCNQTRSRGFRVHGLLSKECQFISRLPV